ncbi:MAG: hypothetical protein JW969_14205 [Spirochaetales bacterium]|nr:hypothetical protein [Spirochaetales bacterium]
MKFEVNILLAGISLVLLFSCLPERVNITPEKGCYAGVYLFRDSWQYFEKKTGKKFAIAMNFMSIQSSGEDFPRGVSEAYWALGKIYDITIEPHLQKLQDIIDGKYDGIYRKWGAGAKELGIPLIFRWGHEMNGKWYTWCGAKNGGATLDGFGDPSRPDGPERYVAAYRRIHDIFDEEGAMNAVWIWCPNIGPAFSSSWNDFENYYPGDEYVDWLGMDGYNWGNVKNHPGWVTFDEVFESMYAAMERINPDKPMIIGEFACTEKDGNKAEWITDAFDRIKTKYTRIKAFVWFNLIKEALWPVDSSVESLEAFRNAMKDPYYLEEIKIVK